MALTKTAGRNENTFDFLRLFAASVVVIAHAQFELGTEVLWNGSQLFDGIGIFFVLSGFLIWQSAERTFDKTGSWNAYFTNRALRILPALYVFAVAMPVVLSALGAMPWSSLFTMDMFVWLGSAFFLLPAYDPHIWASIGTGNMNGHLYTIPAEVSFYIVVPALVYVSRCWGFKWVVAVMAACAFIGPVVGALTDGWPETFVHFTFLERGAYFLAGVVWARYWNRFRNSGLIALVAFAIYAALKVFGPGHDWYSMFQPVLLALPLSYWVIWFGFNGPKALGRLVTKIGDLSYGTYIWHVLILQLLVWQGWVGNWWQVFAVLAISLMVAQVSWRFVEKPALKLKRISSRNRAEDFPPRANATH